MGIEKEYRCKGCHKLLAKGDEEGKISIVCPRCKVYNTFTKINQEVNN